jgi:hypothetical protein
VSGTCGDCARVVPTPVNAADIINLFMISNPSVNLFKIQPIPTINIQAAAAQISVRLAFIGQNALQNILLNSSAAFTVHL